MTNGAHLTGASIPMRHLYHTQPVGNLCFYQRPAAHYVVIMQLRERVIYLMMDVGAADKAAIQLVKVQPYQLLVSDT